MTCFFRSVPYNNRVLFSLFLLPHWKIPCSYACGCVCVGGDYCTVRSDPTLTILHTLVRLNRNCLWLVCVCRWSLISKFKLSWARALYKPVPSRLVYSAINCDAFVSACAIAFFTSLSCCVHRKRSVAKQKSKVLSCERIGSRAKKRQPNRL